ncbi:unnamed protein product [Schistosoma mattheei]|uniref:Uncharacterized protein n=1 Tax=Schistosoma mattheei TaxID=31246 RepID=A0A183P692_9TREM|nr:unnamed protein product [Schistosoma mattheei]
MQEWWNSGIEHFEEFLNRPSDIEAGHTNLLIDVSPPTTEEVWMVISQMKIGKSVGPDNIPADSSKSDTVVTKRVASGSTEQIP